jgi:hypothetical protein
MQNTKTVEGSLQKSIPGRDLYCQHSIVNVWGFRCIIVIKFSWNSSYRRNYLFNFFADRNEWSANVSTWCNWKCKWTICDCKAVKFWTMYISSLSVQTGVTTCGKWYQFIPSNIHVFRKQTNTERQSRYAKSRDDFHIRFNLVGPNMERGGNSEFLEPLPPNGKVTLVVLRDSFGQKHLATRLCSEHICARISTWPFDCFHDHVWQNPKTQTTTATLY